MRAADRTRLTDEDTATLWAMALLNRTSAAEERRRAIAAHAELGRRDPHVAELVRLNLQQWAAANAERAGNVVSLAGRRRTR